MRTKLLTTRRKKMDRKEEEWKQAMRVALMLTKQMKQKPTPLSRLLLPPLALRLRLPLPEHPSQSQNLNRRKRGRRLVCIVLRLLPTPGTTMTTTMMATCLYLVQ